MPPAHEASYRISRMMFGTIISPPKPNIIKRRQVISVRRFCVAPRKFARRWTWKGNCFDRELGDDFQQLERLSGETVRLDIDHVGRTWKNDPQTRHAVDRKTDDPASVRPAVPAAKETG